jgi:hypothetical protein
MTRRASSTVWRSIRVALLLGGLALLGSSTPARALPSFEWPEWRPGRLGPWSQLLVTGSGSAPAAPVPVYLGARWSEDAPAPTALFPSPRLTGKPAPEGGDLACLVQLGMEGVAFEEGPPLDGVATPVRAVGDVIGGLSLRYYYPSRMPRVMDCRLALALARAAPVLRRNGVREIVFASHYRPHEGPLGPEGLNFHEQGLAIDVKGFRLARGTMLWVEHDYEPGLGFVDPSSCLGRPLTAKGMLLRKIVCDLDAADVFEAILTPDYDAVHWNHFHFSTFHHAQQARLRPRGTALLEVPMTELTTWAMSRPCYQEPALRRWDRVAAEAWPAAYAAVRERFGIEEPGEAFAGLTWTVSGLGLLAPVWEVASELWSRVKPDAVEWLRQGLPE